MRSITVTWKIPVPSRNIAISAVRDWIWPMINVVTNNGGKRMVLWEVFSIQSRKLVDIRLEFPPMPLFDVRDWKDDWIDRSVNLRDPR